MKLSDKVYDILKWVAMIALPALGTFMGIVLSSLDVPAETITTVITIISATSTFIGALIGVSTLSYAKDEGGENGDE